MHRAENVPSTIDEFRCWLGEQIDALPQSDFALSDFRQAAETAIRAGEIAVSLGLPDLPKQYPIHHGHLGIGAARTLLREYLKVTQSDCPLPRLPGRNCRDSATVRVRETGDIEQRCAQ